MQLLFDCPWYFILFCLLVGALYSAALYSHRGNHAKNRDKKAKDNSHSTPKTSIKPKSSKVDTADDMPRWVRITLPLLRFLSGSLIAFLLMAPLVKRHVTTREKPLVVVACDVSESTAKVPTFEAGDLKELTKDYEVVFDSFGDKTTNIAAELGDIADRYAARNLGAVILSSDGIYNQGLHPASMATRLAVPIYTVALGDTTHRPDAAIANIRHNQVAYLDNQFPVEVTLRASHLKGRQANLIVSCDGRQLFSKSIAYSDNDFTTTETVTLTANKPGLKKYTITVTPCAGEASTANNTRTIAVEVLDGHEKIAILANAPHPDISALRQSIAANPHYETDLFVADELDRLTPQQLSAYNLIVLHNLPSGTHPSLPLRGLQPTLYIVGNSTDLSRFSALHSGLEIVAKAHKTDDVSAQRNNAFALFSLDNDICQTIQQLPPLSAPFGTYRPSGNLQSLFTARVGNLATDRPLVAFCQQEGVRHAFVVGEGLWRWRLHDYLISQSHDNFDALIDKIVVYTSLQASRERFRVTVPHICLDNEAVTLTAELYDDNFEPVNSPDAICELWSVNGELTNESIAHKTQVTSHRSQKQTYDFNRSGTGYTLHLGALASGRYQYAASTTFAGKKYNASGSFIVQEASLEQVTLAADHALLNTLSQTTGAQMLYPNQVNTLPRLLAQRDDLKTLLHSHTQYTQLLDLLWVFLLIVLLLSAEWALRKLFFKP